MSQRQPLTDSPSRSNFAQPQNHMQHAGMEEKVQDENRSIMNSFAVPRQETYRNKGSVGRSSSMLKKLPSLQEIGMIYKENGGSPVGKVNSNPPFPFIPAANLNKKPSLQKLLTSETDLRNRTKSHPDPYKINRAISPFTAGTGTSPTNSNSRLKLPLSALARVETLANPEMLGPNKRMGLGRSISEGKSTEQVSPLTGMTDQTSANQTISTTSTLLVTPETSIPIRDSSKEDILEKPVLISQADLPGGNWIVGYRGIPTWRELVNERKIKDEEVGCMKQDSTHSLMEGKKEMERPVVPELNLPDDPQPELETILPLQHTWTLYFDTGRLLTAQDREEAGPALTLFEMTYQHDRGKTTMETDFEERLFILDEFSTVQGFAKAFGMSGDEKRMMPSVMKYGYNLHLFKDGIRPMYEDPANTKGGRWTLVVRNDRGLLDRTWQYLVCALIGEQLDENDDICGAVISIRPKLERTQIWVRDKNAFDIVERIGRRLLKQLDLLDEASVVSLEFSGNKGSINGTKPHFQIGGGGRYGSRPYKPSRLAPPGMPRSSSFRESASNSRETSPRQSTFTNPFAAPLGIQVVGANGSTLKKHV